MKKFIKLTNEAEAHKGNPIYINADQITAVYEAAIEGHGFKTFVFGGYTGVQWEVAESPKDVINIIESEIYDS
jgi:hypothetical protein